MSEVQFPHLSSEEEDASFGGWGRTRDNPEDVLSQGVRGRLRVNHLSHRSDLPVHTRAKASMPFQQLLCRAELPARLPRHSAELRSTLKGGLSER